jgi:O-antigen ligase
VWLGAFGYALVIALVNDNLLPGTYDFANFVMPLGIGLWVAADDAPLATAYSRVTRLLFALTTVISVYGIVQYVIAPEWDALWLRNAITGGALSFGRAAPFQIRVFSMLNSPGPFGNFMALMLLLALPQLSLRRPWALAQIPFWLVAFGLSLDRSGWLLFAFGTVVYLLLTPRRGALLATAGLSAALLAVLVVILPAAIGNDAVLTSLNDRFASFSDLDSDRSGKDRLNLYDTGVSLISETPFGHGLGVLGTATKLGDSAATTDFDSGVLARLVEMGIPGFMLFLVTLYVLAAAILRVWRQAGRSRDATLQSIAGMAFAVLISLLETELFGDISGLLILTLWLICGLTIRADSGVGSPRLSLARG